MDIFISAAFLAAFIGFTHGDGFNCDFEANYCGWKNLTHGSLAWLRHSGCTPSTDTGPCVDHTRGDGQGHYLYTETSGLNNPARFALVSPKMNATKGDCFSFWYHMYGHELGTLQVQLDMHMPNGKTQTQTLFDHRYKNLGKKWNYAEFNIESKDPFQIRFESSRTNTYGDMAIDDVKLISGVCGVKFECLNDKMVASVSKASIPAVTVTHVNWLDWNCMATENNDTVSIETGYSDCGTKREVSNGNFIYVNRLSIARTDQMSLITRDPFFEMEIECVIPQTISDSERYMADTRSSNKVVAMGNGVLSPRIHFYNDSAYQNRLSLPTYSNKDVMFIETELMTSDRDLQLKTMECYATPTADPADPYRYVFIENGNATDATVKWLPSPAPTKQRFSIDAFYLLVNSPETYMHCTLCACAAPGNCNGCYMSRGTRDLSMFMYKITAGPIA